MRAQILKKLISTDTMYVTLALLRQIESFAELFYGFQVLSGDKTLNEVAAEHQIAPSTLVEWHKAVQKDLYLVFQKQPELEKEILHRDEQIATLERKVGQLTIERDWLEKKSDELFKSQGTHRAFRIKSQSGLKHSAAV